ncbi:MAG TPA: glycosyltransferase family 4 protein [Terriglobales bacterium]|nr:glycosyltransferase family 4 protein [Terriglobales bacterium]
MRVALVAPPFIPVPPKVYGGTELFIAHLAEGLSKLGIDVVVYCNGESTVSVEKRWIYAESQWPIQGEVYANLKDINHTAWAIRDASSDCDIIHLNNLPGLATSRFVSNRFVYTMHHPSEPGLSAFYQFYPEVEYVTISDFQRLRETMPRTRTIHHGIDLSLYRSQEKKGGYLSFLGRIAPPKGTHLAIEVAKKSGIPLKIAGEVQPIYRDYFDSEIRPHLDGKFIEYVGEADLPSKNELLGNSIAMLFPIQWDEPFGLVMIEAMACGTPVLAMPGGAVQEVVKDGVSGWVCRSTAEMATRAQEAATTFRPSAVREYVAAEFSLATMVARYAQCYEEVLNLDKEDELRDQHVRSTRATGTRAAA